MGICPPYNAQIRAVLPWFASEPRSHVRTTHLTLLCYLREFQFDRRCAAKDRDRHLEALVLFVNFFDHAVEIFERTVVDFNFLTDLKVDQRAWRFFAFLTRPRIACTSASRIGIGRPCGPKKPVTRLIELIR